MSRTELDRELAVATGESGRRAWGFVWKDGLRLLIEHDPDADPGIAV